MRFFVLFIALIGLGCASVDYGPEDCAADVDLANQLVAAVLHEEIDDEAKARKAELYAAIAARIAARGCSLVPEPLPEESDE